MTKKCLDAARETCMGHLHLPRRGVSPTSRIPAGTALSNICRTKTVRIVLQKQIRTIFGRGTRTPGYCVGRQPGAFLSLGMGGTQIF